MLRLLIKERRQAIGLSQHDLASKLSVNQTAVSQWERGAALPSCEKLPELARSLQCKIDDLFSQESA